MAPIKLPPWAQASSFSAVGQQSSSSVVSLEEEEVYLRTRAYHSVSHQIDDALQMAVDSNIKDLCSRLQAFFQKCRPSSSMYRSMHTETEPSHSHRFAVEPPRHYKPSMLPLAILHSPPNLLDQRRLSTALTTCLKQQTTTERLAVCHLSQPVVLSTNHCGPLLEEIIRQCIQQDHFQLAKSVSQVDRLKSWAQSTRMFDELVVIVEGTEGLSTRLLQDFVSLIASLRHDHGLVIQLILISSTFNTTTLHLQYDGNHVLTTTMSLPSSQHLVNELWEQLLQTPTTLLSPTTLSGIQSSFQNHHASFVKTAILLKQALALQYATKGSALMMGMGDGALLPKEEDETRRLAWFYLTQDGRKTLTGSKTTTTKESLLQRQDELDELQGTLHAGMTALRHLSSSSSTIEIVESLQHPQLMKSMSMKLAKELLPKLSNKELLMKLGAIRESLLLPKKEATVSSSVRTRIGLSSSSSIVPRSAALQTTINATNEMILLFVENNDNNEMIKQPETNHNPDLFQQNLWQAVEEWILGLLHMLDTTHQKLQELSQQQQQQQQQQPNDNDVVTDTILPQHRRRVASTLIEGNVVVAGSQEVQLTTVPSILFRLMDGRVAIPRYDWFQLYKEWTNKLGDDNEEAWSLFALGVYQLIYVGLIRERRGGSNRAETVYEKAALVWSTGD